MFPTASSLPCQIEVSGDITLLLRAGIRTDLFGISLFEPFARPLTHSGASAMFPRLRTPIERQRAKRL